MLAVSEGFYFDNYSSPSRLEMGLYYGGKSIRVLLSSCVSIVDLSLQAIHIVSITIISAIEHIEASISSASSTYSSNLQYFYLVIFAARAFTRDHLQFLDDTFFNTNLSNLSDRYFDFWNK